MTKGAPGAEGGAGNIIRDVHSAPTNDLDSSDDSLWEQVLKVVAQLRIGTSRPLRRSRRVRRAGTWGRL